MDVGRELGNKARLCFCIFSDEDETSDQQALVYLPITLEIEDDPAESMNANHYSGSEVGPGKGARKKPKLLVDIDLKETGAPREGG